MHALSLHVLRSGDDTTYDFEDEGDTADTFYGNTYGWIGLQSLFSRGLTANTTVSLGRLTTDRQGTDYLNDGVRIDAFADDQRDFSFAGVKQDWSYDAGSRHFLKWGFDVRELKARYEYFNYDRQVRIENQRRIVYYDTTTADLSPDGRSAGFYVADRFRLFEPLTVEAGVRYDVHSRTGDKKVSPRLNLAGALGPQTVLRAAWGRYHQSQQLYELGVQDGDTRFYPAERAEHLVAGIEHGFDEHSLIRVELYRRKLRDVRPFYWNLDNQIEVFPEVEDDRMRIEPDRGLARGVELYVRHDDGGMLGFWASCSIANMRYSMNGRKYPAPPDRSGTFYFDGVVRPNDRWRLNIAWAWYSGLSYTSQQFTATQVTGGGYVVNVAYGGYNDVRFPAYHSLNLRINRQFTVKRGELSTFLELINLYGRENVRNYWYDFQIQNGQLTVLKHAEHWFPFLPSIGVSWEF